MTFEQAKEIAIKVIDDSESPYFDSDNEVDVEELANIIQLNGKKYAEKFIQDVDERDVCGYIANSEYEKIHEEVDEYNELSEREEELKERQKEKNNE